MLSYGNKDRFTQRKKKNEGEIKTFPWKQKLKELIITRPALR